MGSCLNGLVIQQNPTVPIVLEPICMGSTALGAPKIWKVLGRNTGPTGRVCTWFGTRCYHD